MKEKFTVKDILDFKPCHAYNENKIKEIFESVGCEKYITVKLLFEIDIPIKDFLWLILRKDFISVRELHEIGIWCFEGLAKQNWIKYYPEDNRPLEAIRIKKLWLDGKATDDELSAAYSAAKSAAESSAESSAYSAMYSSADSAAESSLAICSGVCSAAYSAVYSFARPYSAAYFVACYKIKNHIAEIIGVK